MAVELGTPHYVVARTHRWTFTDCLINSQSVTTNYTHPLYTVAPMV